jgi:hypothetical protein
LNITEQDADLLKSAILKGLEENQVVPGIKDKYGKRYSVDIKIRNLDKEAIVRTGWIIKKDENFPRFTTCYINRKL